MITNCLEEKNLPVYGSGENIRDWIYVDDHCDALNTILSDGIIGESYNIGGNNEIDNLSLVKYICDLLDNRKPRLNGKKYNELITFVNDRAGHDFRYAINSSKINNELQWSPKESFKTGILKTIDWYINNDIWWKKLKNKPIKMKILVTGSSGFIGYHLTKSLLRDGNIVYGLDSMNNYYDIKLKRERLKNLTKYDGFNFSELNLVDGIGLEKNLKHFLKL